MTIDSFHAKLTALFLWYNLCISVIIIIIIIIINIINSSSSSSSSNSK